MRVLPRPLKNQMEDLEKILNLKLVQGFEAIFMVTNDTVEEILSRLIADLKLEEYIEAGFVISHYLNIPREKILTDRKKIATYLRTVEHLEVIQVKASTNFSIPGFAKKLKNLAGQVQNEV